MSLLRSIVCVKYNRYSRRCERGLVGTAAKLREDGFACSCGRGHHRFPFRGTRGTPGLRISRPCIENGCGFLSDGSLVVLEDIENSFMLGGSLHASISVRNSCCVNANCHTSDSNTAGALCSTRSEGLLFMPSIHCNTAVLPLLLPDVA